MFLSPFFTKENGAVRISAEQASQFAKQIANDFNPIHDENAKRFCVPGDLLFALVLTQCGTKQQMHFNFEGMVGRDVNLQLPESPESPFDVTDGKKTFLTVHQAGHTVTNQSGIEALIRSYVAFSGLNFTDVLVPLMKDAGVMINPKRPLVMYQNMSFELDVLEFESVSLEVEKQELVHNGKRGDVLINFILKDGDKLIGTGKKNLVLSGLSEYDQAGIDELEAAYAKRATGDVVAA